MIGTTQWMLGYAVQANMKSPTVTNGAPTMTVSQLGYLVSGKSYEGKRVNRYLGAVSTLAWNRSLDWLDPTPVLLDDGNAIAKKGLRV